MADKAPNEWLLRRSQSRDQKERIAKITAPISTALAGLGILEDGLREIYEDLHSHKLTSLDEVAHRVNFLRDIASKSIGGGQ